MEKKLHNEELDVLYYSPNIVQVIKWRSMRWAGHVARIRHVAKPDFVLLIIKTWISTFKMFKNIEKSLIIYGRFLCCLHLYPVSQGIRHYRVFGNKYLSQSC